MSTGLDLDLKQLIVSTSAFGPREIDQITAAIANNYNRYRDLRDAVGELEAQENRSPAMNARLGVCYYLLGRYSEAIETLSHSDGGALTHFYLGKAYLALDKYDEALTAFRASFELVETGMEGEFGVRHFAGLDRPRVRHRLIVRRLLHGVRHRSKPSHDEHDRFPNSPPLPQHLHICTTGAARARKCLGVGCCRSSQAGERPHPPMLGGSNACP